MLDPRKAGVSPFIASSKCIVRKSHFKPAQWAFPGDPGVQWLRIRLPGQGAWVLSLVGELRSHMPQSSSALTAQLEKPAVKNQHSQK